MSKQVIGILIAAALIAALAIWFPNRQQDQSPVADSIGLPGDSQPGSAVEPTDTAGRTQAVVGEPVNPVIDRWGVPASEMVQITPEEAARISSATSDGRIQGRTTDSHAGDPGLGGLPGPDASNTGSVGFAPEASDTGILGPAPEVSDPGVMGPAPESSDPGIMGPAPEASDPGIMGPAPEAGAANILGPAPEASDPGSIGPAPEAGDSGPGGQRPGTDGPPPEGY
ncbi:MAG: hypothetical protein OER85_19150 [Gammaproteobacteria bacterium]|nr:hypothetical protein [Gammaproteobacteria bacterium]